jgi:hypothetical protein
MGKGKQNEAHTIELNHRSEALNASFIPTFSSFLMANLKIKTGLKDMVMQYEAIGQKRTRRAYEYAVRKLEADGKIKVARYEQLYIFPISMDSKNIRSDTIENEATTIERAHSTHRTLLSMPYTGTQPEAGATRIKPFGRYGTARQIIFKQGDLTIVAYRKKLNVWVHKPPGTRTAEQLLEAKVIGYRALVAFARTHSLALEGYLNRVLFSHHVIENEALNAAMKDLLTAYPEIEARIGSKVCETSHKGKVEHEGKARPDRVIRGDMVARGLEYITLDFPEQYADFCRLIPEYHAQLKLHLEVEARTLDTLNKQNEALKELTKAIKEGKVV